MSAQAESTGPPPARDAPPSHLLDSPVLCGHVVTQMDGTIVRANQRIAHMVGQPLEKIVAATRLQDLFSIGSQMYFETHIHPLLRLQEFVEQIALELRGPSGSLPVLLNAVVQPAEADRPRHIEAILVDATDRRRYELELLAERNRAEEAASRTAELVSMVSHDLRTPIATIATVGELLESTELSEEQAQMVRMLRSSTGSLLELVNDVLDRGRLDAGQMHLERQRFDLRQLAERLGDESRPRAESKGLTFDSVIDPAIPAEVVGDRIKVSRVLSNLLANAIKFTKRGSVSLGLRLLSTDQSEAVVEFEVRDTGIGIPDSALDSIFEDFSQGHHDRDEHYGGSGLGLGICERLLGLQGSTLQVESEPGSGSRFYFELRFDLT